jgi:hypothetical protein
MHPLRPLLVSTGLLALASAGCGNAVSSSTATSTTTHPVWATLQVTLWPDAAKTRAAFAYTLICASGDSSTVTAATATPATFVVNAADACAAVSHASRALWPGVQNMMCTMIYGGPQQMRINGVVDGRAVHRTITRADGCQIAFWHQLAPLGGTMPLGPAPV